MLLANRTRAKAEALAARIGAAVSGNKMIAEEADHIFLGVKPQMMADMLTASPPRSKSAAAPPCS